MTELECDGWDSSSVFRVVWLAQVTAKRTAGFWIFARPHLGGLCCPQGFCLTLLFELCERSLAEKQQESSFRPILRRDTDFHGNYHSCCNAEDRVLNAVLFSIYSSMSDCGLF